MQFGYFEFCEKKVLRFLASVSHLRMMCYRITSLTVWMLCHCGSQPIGSSSITTRWKHSGVHHNAVNTRSHPDPFASAAHLCNQLSSHYRQESQGGLLGCWCYCTRSRDFNCLGCFAIPRHTRSMCHCLPRPALVSLLHALVINKVDYCTAVLCWLVHLQFYWIVSSLCWMLLSQAGFLSKEIRPHYLTSLRATLAQSTRADQVPMCVLTHCFLHDMAPCYLAETIYPVSSCASWRHLRSTYTSELIVPRCCSMIGDCAFPVATVRAWNSLPPFIRDAPSQVTFRREFKTFLFRSSFPVQWQLTTGCLSSTYCSNSISGIALGLCDFMTL